MPEAGDANPYNSTPHPSPAMIYRNSGLVIATPPPGIIPVTGDQGQQMQVARNLALDFLIKKTERWSDTQTIRLGNSSETHIIVTHLHPELIQAAYLNEILENKQIVQDIESQMTQITSQASRRQEILFILTVITNHRDSFNTGNKIKLRVGELKLINSESTPVQPSHYDPSLDQPIDTSQGPVFGLVAYPIGIQPNNTCVWILDTTYNNTIVLATNSILVDEINHDTYTWTIRYKPLIDTGIPSDLLDPSTSNHEGWQPTSGLIPPGDMSNGNFWRDYSHFIWKHILSGN